MQSKWPIRAALLGFFVFFATFSSGPAAALETSLTVPGGPDGLQDRLSQSSSVMSADARGLDSPLELLSAALSDYRTMVQIMYDEGFFSPVVNIRLDGREAADIDPLNTPTKVDRIDITVQPGPAFRFGKADISPIAPETELPESYAPGKPATTGAIRDAASAAIQGWREAGYAKAEVGDQRVTARHREAQLDSDIDIATGRRLTFGKMSIKGTSDVRPESIAKIAGFPSGEQYSPQKIQKVGTRLRRTGTFNVVTLREADTPNADDTLDFESTFEDLPKRRITFGLELSSRNGLDITSTWLHRNLFGGAERLRFDATIRNIGGDEDIDGGIGLRLDRPDTLGPDDNTFYIANIERRNRTHYNITTATVGIGVRRTFSDRLFAEGYVGTNYSRSDDAFGNDRPFRYIVFPLRAEWDQRDNKVSATRGYFLETRVTPLIGLSDTDSGGQITLDSRGYWDVNTGGRVVLAGRLLLGSLIGPSLAAVSPDYLFYSGGAGTVRGQPFESLGIPVGTGIAGGKSFLAVNAEIRGKITEKIALVGFYDHGTVGADAFVDSNSVSHAGAGLGIRYDLGGFGPLRFDLAYPTSGVTGDGLQFYLGIGQAF